MTILPLRNIIRTTQQKTNLAWEIIEQDYVLSWVLYGVCKIDKLKSSLIFKGGTALKKCYFGDYRFSQDLDFSVQGDYPKGEDLLNLLLQACEIACIASDTIDLKCSRYSEKREHPHEQEAFNIYAKLPWQKDFLTCVKIEVTTQEPVLLNPNELKIIHLYEEHLDASIFTYQLEEIIAEKIRAILQFAKKLHERGWGRSRVRDYYDLWRILKEYGNQINTNSLPDLVKRKCLIKDVEFKAVEDLFQGRLMEHLIEWDKWLGPLVPNTPDKEVVIAELHTHLDKIFR